MGIAGCICLVDSTGLGRFCEHMTITFRRRWNRVVQAKKSPSSSSHSHFKCMHSCSMRHLRVANWAITDEKVSTLMNDLYRSQGSVGRVQKDRQLKKVDHVRLTSPTADMSSWQ